jgi:hypothetical protein
VEVEVELMQGLRRSRSWWKRVDRWTNLDLLAEAGTANMRWRWRWLVIHLMVQVLW